MSNYEPCVDSTGATESSLLDEAALTESTYGDSRSLKMRQQLQADMADLARTTPNVSLLLLLTLFSHIISINPCIYLSYRVL